MKNNYIYRKESFGYTKYNISTMTHEFVNEIDTPYERYIDLPQDIYKENGLLIAPIRIYVETTLKCNLSCPYCFNIVGNHGELNTERMLDAISLFSASGVIDLRFTGGEVTMRKDWDILLSHAKKLGFVISVNTNGAYKSKKIIEKFVSIRPNQITFSIDGIGSRHDEIRGEGSFNKLVDNMKQLSKEGLNLRLNCTLSKKNIDQVDDILLLAEKYCKEINFFGLREIGEGEKYNHSLSFDEFSNISKYVQSKSNDRLYVCGGHQIMNDMSINVNDHDLVKGSPDLTTRFNITSDGTYYSGGYLPFVSKSLALGKVYDSPNSLYEIWHNSKKLQEIRLASHRLKEECYGCKEYGDTCNGGILELELQKRIKGIENPYCIKDVNIFDGVENF